MQEEGGRAEQQPAQQQQPFRAGGQLLTSYRPSELPHAAEELLSGATDPHRLTPLLQNLTLQGHALTLSTCATSGVRVNNALMNVWGRVLLPLLRHPLEDPPPHSPHPPLPHPTPLYTILLSLGSLKHHLGTEPMYALLAHLQPHIPRLAPHQLVGCLQALALTDFFPHTDARITAHFRQQQQTRSLQQEAAQQQTHHRYHQQRQQPHEQEGGNPPSSTSSQQLSSRLDALPGLATTASQPSPLPLWDPYVRHNTREGSTPSAPTPSTVGEGGSEGRGVAGDQASPTTTSTASRNGIGSNSSNSNHGGGRNRPPPLSHPLLSDSFLRDVLDALLLVLPQLSGAQVGLLIA